MFGLFSPRCPLGPREQVWVERGMARLIDVIGLERMRQTPVLTLDDLSEVVRVEPISAAAVAERVGRQLPFPIAGIEWLEEPDLEGRQVAYYRPGQPPIGVVPHQLQQTAEERVAAVARCLCEHALSVGTVTITSPFAPDLLAVIAGLGLFGANRPDSIQDLAVEATLGVRRRRLLPSRMSGYALALREWLCEQEDSALPAALRLDAREPFVQGRKYLRKRRPVVWDVAQDRLRTFATAPAIDDVCRRLRHREAAAQINAMADLVEFQLTDARCLQELAGLVHDPSDEVREELIQSIATLNTSSAELGEVLIMLCDDAVTSVRARAALAVGTIQTVPADAEEALRTLLRDAEPAACAAAAEALLRFPAGLEDERPRLFRVLRQQLARCDYERVERFLQRLQAHCPHAARVITEEFSGHEDDSWRQMLLESLEGLTIEAAAPTTP